MAIDYYRSREVVGRELAEFLRAKGEPSTSPEEVADKARALVKKWDEEDD